MAIVPACNAAFPCGFNNARERTVYLAKTNNLELNPIRPIGMGSSWLFCSATWNLMLNQIHSRERGKIFLERRAGGGAILAKSRTSASFLKSANKECARESLSVCPYVKKKREKEGAKRGWGWTEWLSATDDKPKSGVHLQVF